MANKKHVKGQKTAFGSLQSLTEGLRGHGKRTSTSESVHQTRIFTCNSRSGLGDSIACLLIVSSGRSVLTLVGPNEGPTAKPDYGDWCWLPTICSLTRCWPMPSCNETGNSKPFLMPIWLCKDRTSVDHITIRVSPIRHLVKTQKTLTSYNVKNINGHKNLAIINPAF